MPAPSDDIVTPRLILRLMGRETVDAGLAGDLARAEHLLDAKIPGSLLDHPSSLTHAKARLEADPQYQPWSMAVSRPHITGIGGVPRAAPTKSIGPSLRRCWCKNSAEIEIRDRAGSATPRIRQPAGRTG
jgi:hypothetical protein